MKPLTAVVKHEKAVYPYMPLEKRKKILPKRNACSLYPATQQNDAMITGNGTLRAEIYGDPFEETIVYGHELLYVPIRKKCTGASGYGRDSAGSAQTSQRGRI